MAKKITLEAIQDPVQLQRLLNAMQTQIDNLITLANELNAWAETLAAKLNLDSGVNDQNYDATITAADVTDLVTATL
jgi:hypothetical protein